MKREKRVNVRVSRRRDDTRYTDAKCMGRKGIIMRVDGVTGYTNVNAGTIASGKRINSAADDAAGLTQVQNLKSQDNGMQVGGQNAKDGINLTKIGDGALSGIHSYLQSIKSASVKASSGLLTASDKGAIQKEIDGYLQGITDIVSNTTYNTKNLLNGENTLGMATNPDGTGPDVKTANATLKALGLEGYNVTGNFDMSRVDKAIDQVSSMRSSMGASANALEGAYNYNMNASENLAGATSRIEDLDMPKAISDQKKEEVLEEYKNMMLRSQMEEESLVTKLMK